MVTSKNRVVCEITNSSTTFAATWTVSFDYLSRHILDKSAFDHELGSRNGIMNLDSIDSIRTIAFVFGDIVGNVRPQHAFDIVIVAWDSIGCTSCSH